MVQRYEDPEILFLGDLEDVQGSSIPGDPEPFVTNHWYAV